MRCIIELKDGNWLADTTDGSLAGSEDLQGAKVFQSPEEARHWARHLGLAAYDVWSEDGETWIEDRYYVQGVGLTNGEDLTRPLMIRNERA
jgi:hypothetical protein